MLDAPPISSLDRYRGCLLGGAAGDALGAAVEFDDDAAILRHFGPEGIREPAMAYGRIGAITDDTQMTLFTAEGILQADDRLQRGIGNPPVNVWFAYQRWLQTQGTRSPWTQEPAQLGHGELHRVPELNTRRAPGNTCLSALARGLDIDAGGNLVAANDSKGCGGVMRAAPCGLVAGWDRDAPFRLGVASAALTHGHPSGYLAAGALAVIVRRICDQIPLDAAVAEALDTVRSEHGSGEVVRALTNARERAGAEGDPDVAGLGQGWVAEEALAIAVYCALVHRDDFSAAVRLAANHAGDSDSTAAITGNIVGTLLGAQAIPERWLGVLELRDTIDRLATAMHDRFVNGRRDVDWNLWNYPKQSEEKELSTPPHDAYWVEPGRLLAGPYPGAKARVEAEPKLEDFLDLGVTCFIDLTEEGEGKLEPYAALLLRLAAKREIEVTHLRMPIRDVDICPAWRMRAIHAAIAHALDAGEVVYVHCWGGVGRTGTVIGCRLVENDGHSGEDALHELTRMRRNTQRAHRVSPETTAQRTMVREWSCA